MDAARILAIANDEKTRHFNFGSPALEEWTRECRSPITHAANETSEFYVVRHKSLDPQKADFRVLSRWCYGELVPRSWSVPEEGASAGQPTQ